MSETVTTALTRKNKKEYLNRMFHRTELSVSRLCKIHAAVYIQDVAGDVAGFVAG